MLRVLFTLMTHAIILVSSAVADVPQVISYQGRLVDSLGVAVPDGDYAVTFSLYISESSSDPEWICAKQTVPVENGLFVYLLGNACPLEDNFFAKSADVWLGLEIVGIGELTPRTRLTSTPYAYHALRADTAWYVDAGTSGWTDEGTVLRLDNANDSVGVGTAAPSTKLDVAGEVNVTGDYQIAGTPVLTTAGSNNLCVGNGAGASNTGVGCTIVGDDAGPSNQGDNNVMVGRAAGFDNITGEKNTFVGQGSGGNNDAGSNNTFIGRWAGYYNTDGTHNTYLGSAAGSQAYGDTNTYVGVSAGALNNGSHNVFVGPFAGYNVDVSNKLFIANSGVSTPLIYGDFGTGRVGIGTTSPGAPLHVTNGSGTAIKAEAEGFLASAVWGTSNGTGGAGVYGVGNGTIGIGIRGYSAESGGKGAHGSSEGSEGYGVYGSSTGSEAFGVYGTSAGWSSHGVYGEATGPLGRGLYGRAEGTEGIGVYGEAIGGIGIYAAGLPGIEAHGLYGASAADFYGNVTLYDANDSSLVMELGSGLDYAEGFESSANTQIEPGTVMVIDALQPGKLRVSAEAYDRKVAGIVAGANGLGSGVRLGGDEFDLDIALAGRVYCLVEATHGDIQPGDLLTTSSIPGYAMKASDTSQSHGAILGKAMEPLSRGNRGSILVLVTLH